MKRSIQIAILIFLSATTSLFAQSNFKPAYVITNENDSVYGLVNLRLDRLNVNSCKFKENKDAKTTTYLPTDIAGYRFIEEGKYYVSRDITLDEKQYRVFLEYLIEGTMNLYYFTYTDAIAGKKDYYFFENQEGEMIQITQKKDQIVDGKRKIDTHYKGTLNYIFKEYPNIGKNLKETSFDRNSMINITKEYHALTCAPGEECIQFENDYKKSFVNTRLSLYAGFQLLDYTFLFDNSMKEYSFENSFYPTIGGQFTISDSRWLKSFSFFMDLSLSGIKQTPTYNTKSYKINTLLVNGKIGIQYTYPSGRFRPIANAGLSYSLLTDASGKYIDEDTKYEEKRKNLLSDSFLGYAAAIGADYMLNNKNAIIFRVGYNWQKNGDKIKILQFTLGYIL